MTDAALTLKNYSTILPKALLKHKGKYQVRECEEGEKGRYIAYVDDGPESYDVSVTISSKGEVVEHNCDCGNASTLCKHRLALLQHLSEDTKPKARSKAKHKENKTEALLNQLSEDELRTWVKELLLKNKDLELSFSQRFSRAQLQYTPAEAEKLTNNAIKITIGSKRNIDATLLKKVTDLLAEVHAPIIERYSSQIAEEAGFLLLHSTIEACDKFSARINTNSNRISKYIEITLQRTVAAIHNLQTEAAFENAVGYFVRHLTTEDGAVRIYYLKHLKNIGDLSSEARQLLVIAMLAKHYKGLATGNFYNYGQYTKLLFDMVERANLLEAFYEIFEPIRYDNTYNCKLIKLLIDHEELPKAERLCKQQISANVRGEFDIPYLELLKEIYTKADSEEGLCEVLSELLPYTYSVDDFYFVSERIEEQERQKLRSGIMSRARNASRNFDSAAAAFYYAVLDREGKYKKMIEVIDNYIPYRIIVQYFEPMARTDRSLLLAAILNRSDSSWYFEVEDELDDDAVSQLYTLLTDLFGEDDLQNALYNHERKGYHRSNRLIAFVKNKEALDAARLKR